MVAAEIPLTTLLSGIASGLSAESPIFVSASMDDLDLIVARHFDDIEPAELCTICAVVWKATETAAASAACRSAIKFEKTPIECYYLTGWPMTSAWILEANMFWKCLRFVSIRSQTLASFAIGAHHFDVGRSVARIQLTWRPRQREGRPGLRLCVAMASEAICDDHGLSFVPRSHGVHRTEGDT
jgi:hypothetical protein